MYNGAFKMIKKKERNQLLLIFSNKTLIFSYLEFYFIRDIELRRMNLWIKLWFNRVCNFVATKKKNKKKLKIRTAIINEDRNWHSNTKLHEPLQFKGLSSSNKRAFCQDLFQHRSRFKSFLYAQNPPLGFIHKLALCCSHLTFLYIYFLQCISFILFFSLSFSL